MAGDESGNGGGGNVAMVTGLIIAARILSNPIANVFQKELTRRSADPLYIIGVTHALLTLAVLPLAFGAGRLPSGAGFWGNLVGCAVLAVASNVLLVHALKVSDLSVLGPINAYKAVISLGLGIVVLGEVPGMVGLAGVLLILVGSGWVVDRAPDQSRRRAWQAFLKDPGVRLRLAALVLSATEAVFLKRALQEGSPLATFVGWSMLGLPLALLGIALVRPCGVGPGCRVLVREWPRCVGLAAATGVMQATTLFTFSAMPVGYSLALFQLSAVVSVLLGHQVFREGNFRRRLLGSVVMVAGASLIVGAERGR